MSFVARLRPELIRVAPPWRTFTDTITGLVAMLAAAGALPADSEAAAISAVTAREASASTALLDIYAGVPHARLRGWLGRPCQSPSRRRASTRPCRSYRSRSWPSCSRRPRRPRPISASWRASRPCCDRPSCGPRCSPRRMVRRPWRRSGSTPAQPPEPWRHGSHLPGDVLVERSSLDLDRIGPGEAIDNAIRRRKGEGGTVCLEGLPDIRLSGPRRTALDP